MKNILLKAATLICLVVIFGACTKEGDSKPTPNQNSETAHELLEQLRSFRKQIEAVKTHPEMKSEETMDLSDALWGIENNFNLSYSDSDPYYSEIHEHEFSLTLCANEQQQVLVYDVANLYEQVIAKAREAILSEEFDEKGFVSLTIKNVNQDNRGVDITFLGKTGNRSNYNPPIPHVDGPFGVDDDWMYAAPLGKCDDPDIPSGADEQLQEKLYIELIEPYTETEPGYRNAYLNRISIYFSGCDYPNLFCSPDSTELCIEHEYMNDYYYAEKKAITQYVPLENNLLGYSPIAIEIRGRKSESAQTLTHFNTIEYGIRTTVSIEEFGDIEDL